MKIGALEEKLAVPAPVELRVIVWPEAPASAPFPDVKICMLVLPRLSPVVRVVVP